MRVWTDGANHLVVGQRGLEIYRAGQPPALHPFSDPARGSWPARHVLAVSSRDPLRAWIGRGQRVYLVTIGDAVQVGRAVPAHVLEAVGLPDGRVLACLGPSSEDIDAAGDAHARARLVILQGDAPDPAAAVEVKVPKAPRIAWPGGIWAKDAVPWPEEEVEEGDPPPLLDALAVAYTQRAGAASFDDVTCSVNDHGIAFAGAYSGLVLALSPDGTQVDFALRVPTQSSDTEIHAARTAEGVLIVLSIERRQSAILHLAPDGRVITSRDRIGKEIASGLGPPVVQGDKVMLFETGASGGPRLHEITLADLKATKTVEAPGRAAGELSTSAGPDGNPFVLGFGDVACLLERGGRGRLLARQLEPPAPPPPPPAPKPGPVRASGPPSLALAGPGAPRVWTTAAGEALTLEIRFTNHGGPGKGVSVEVGGPALQAGLVQPRRVVLDDLEAALPERGTASRAELPGFTIVAGMGERPPKGEAFADPAVRVARVELVGVKAGTAVLTVRITPLGAVGGRGSVLQGKSLTITG